MLYKGTLSPEIYVGTLHLELPSLRYRFVWERCTRNIASHVEIQTGKASHLEKRTALLSEQYQLRQQHS